MAYNKSPFKMVGKSPLMKQLIGKQSMLPEGLQAAIKASPAKKYGHSPANDMEQESSGATDAITGKNVRKKVRQDSSGATDVMTGKKADRKARQDSSGVKDVMTGSPAKQVEEVTDDKQAGQKGQRPARQKMMAAPKTSGKKADRQARKDAKPSPAKEINKLSARTINQGDKAEAAYAKGNTKKGNKHTARAARMDARNMKKIGKFNKKASPMKQVKLKDLPEKAVETGEKILEGGKKFIKKIGNITLISKARQDCKKAGGKYSKKDGCFMPENKKKEAK